MKSSVELWPKHTWKISSFKSNNLKHLYFFERTSNWSELWVYYTYFSIYFSICNKKFSMICNGLRYIKIKTQILILIPKVGPLIIKYSCLSEMIKNFYRNALLALDAISDPEKIVGEHYSILKWIRKQQKNCAGDDIYENMSKTNLTINSHTLKAN